MTARNESAQEHREWSAPEQQRVVPAQRARQGIMGQNVRYVLAFGLGALVIVFAIIWLVYFA